MAFNRNSIELATEEFIDLTEKGKIHRKLAEIFEISINKGNIVQMWLKCALRKGE